MRCSRSPHPTPPPLVGGSSAHRLLSTRRAPRTSLPRSHADGPAELLIFVETGADKEGPGPSLPQRRVRSPGPIPFRIRTGHSGCDRNPGIGTYQVVQAVTLGELTPGISLKRALLSCCSCYVRTVQDSDNHEEQDSKKAIVDELRAMQEAAADLQRRIGGVIAQLTGGPAEDAAARADLARRTVEQLRALSRRRRSGSGGTRAKNGDASE